jgi:hypothetical protein
VRIRSTFRGKAINSMAKPFFEGDHGDVVYIPHTLSGTENGR